MQRKRGLSLNYKAETLCERNVCEEGGVSIVRNQSQSRKRSTKEKGKETKDIRQLKKLASEMSRFMWKFSDFLSACYVVDADYFRHRNSCHLPCQNMIQRLILTSFKLAWLDYLTRQIVCNTNRQQNHTASEIVSNKKVTKAARDQQLDFRCSVLYRLVQSHVVVVVQCL